MPNRPLDTALKVVDNVDAMLGYWGHDLRCRFANAAYETWFGRSRQEVIGMSMQDVLGPLYERNLPHILGALAGEVQVFEREILLPDGTVRHSLASYYPDIVDGQVLGFSVQVADVTKLKKLEFELEAARQRAEMLATHDFLTGLPNRVLLMERMVEAMSESDRRGGVLGVVAIDMDGFKKINDTHGHAAGDAVLREVAQRMRGAVRVGDRVTRLGGDEFVYLVPGVETEADVVAAVRRLQAAAGQRMRWEGVEMRPHLSCGIAMYPRQGRDGATLLAAADRALYQCKRGLGSYTMFAE